MDSIGLNLALVALLIFLTAFFVATEFAIIRIRPSRVNQLVLEGRKGALAVQRVTSNLDGYLSACQLGITITALGLGWLGEPTVEELLHPLFTRFELNERVSSLLSFLIAFVIVTYLHVVVGELAPKSWAIQKAEFISFLVAKPIILFHKVLYPFIWVLNGSANGLIRLFGLHPAKEHEDAHSEEEIQIILSESLQSGKINTTEYGYVSRIFAFDEMVAREIMVPRTDMVCLFTNHTREENLAVIQREQYTRFPVATESKDNIVGMINTKQLFLTYQEDKEFKMKDLIHPVLSVPESIPVKQLLQRMQRDRVHIAILVDEYGGTSGLITIEDILEEIVGEIRDEFDEDERREIEKLEENCYLLDGKVSLDELGHMVGHDFNDEDTDTIGGWLYARIPSPKPGFRYEFDNMTFIIREATKNRIRKVEMIIRDSADEFEDTPELHDQED
ncbi:MULTISPECIES: hemolysin family protein [Paenibacillus]|uniref:hemolysin family protein n=1 Tax=Paenibacillus TaxID=44249 RepID=UPI000953A231|nr:MULTISPECIES: hemolysin family protein [Paenibacillus]ASS67630.1 HlyC/CorC family transporter [Paenibacillus sp. RUD330]SIQ70046.1 Hemolysin, contains CBS domains [Paenibacillus sp. RU4X]SIQ91894.1 Hemolysin, contains CBS domains [Paenibacillus sp. RU4T]